MTPTAPLPRAATAASAHALVEQALSIDVTYVSSSSVGPLQQHCVLRIPPEPTSVSGVKSLAAAPSRAELRGGHGGVDALAVDRDARLAAEKRRLDDPSPQTPFRSRRQAAAPGSTRAAPSTSPVHPPACIGHGHLRAVVERGPAAGPDLDLEEVRLADEVGDEARRRLVVDLAAASRSARSRPSLMTAMRVAIDIASSWSCVTYTNVVPTSRWICASSICSRWRSFRSSAPSGSSSSSTAGRLTSARATATRCCWPPESWPGSRSPNSSSPTSCKRLLDAPARDSRRRDARHLQPEADVVAHGHVREERVRLEDGVDAAPVRRQAVDPFSPRMWISPLVGVDEAADQVERRRLAAARRPEQAEELALGDLEVVGCSATLRPVALRDAARRIAGRGVRAHRLSSAQPHERRRTSRTGMLTLAPAGRRRRIASTSSSAAAAPTSAGS